MGALILAVTLSWTNTCAGAVPVLTCAFEVERFEQSAWAPVVTTPVDAETANDPTGDSAMPYRVRAIGVAPTVGTSEWAYSSHAQLPPPFSVTITIGP